MLNLGLEFDIGRSSDFIVAVAFATGTDTVDSGFKLARSAFAIARRLFGLNHFFSNDCAAFAGVVGQVICVTSINRESTTLVDIVGVLSCMHLALESLRNSFQQTIQIF